MGNGLQKSGNLPPAMAMPPEIFQKVCSFLSPDELFALLRVCRYFRFLLTPTQSKLTQEIWRTSRLPYLPRNAPPKGMSEQQYVLLAYWLSRCQFCRGRRGMESKVYWAFRVRACRYCLLDRIISKHRLLHDWKIPKGVLAGLPFISINNYDIYWIAHIVPAEFEYSTMVPTQRPAWTNAKRQYLRQFMEDIEEFELAYKYNMIGWYYDEQEVIRKTCMVDDIAAEMSIDPNHLRGLRLFKEPLDCLSWPPQEKDWTGWRYQMVFEYLKLIQNGYHNK
ncbi:12824_t:CDS:2 [Ambispora leptoticha]|uniref:12824_t:CDS:1 n=1 Tax=Ambispora leptoticha TaxID=144679 RepID=A0A9N9AHD8_9GLOM|nr:12824_t:CDS:2 [Ambispora leptoticha]